MKSKSICTSACPIYQVGVVELSTATDSGRAAIIRCLLFPCPRENDAMVTNYDKVDVGCCEKYCPCLVEKTMWFIAVIAHFAASSSCFKQSQVAGLEILELCSTRLSVCH